MRPFKTRSEKEKSDPRRTMRPPPLPATFTPPPEPETETVGSEGGGQGKTRGIWGGPLKPRR
jgi:hypothetical protein